MSVILASEFSWLGLIPAIGHREDGLNLVPFAHSCLVVLLLLIVAFIARATLMKRMAAGDDRSALVPQDKLRPLNFFELLTEFVYGL